MSWAMGYGYRPSLLPSRSAFVKPTKVQDQQGLLDYLCGAFKMGLKGEGIHGLQAV